MRPRSGSLQDARRFFRLAAYGAHPSAARAARVRDGLGQIVASYAGTEFGTCVEGAFSLAGTVAAGGRLEPRVAATQSAVMDQLVQMAQMADLIEDRSKMAHRGA